MTVAIAVDNKETIMTEQAKHWRVVYDSGTMSNPMSKRAAKKLAQRFGAKRIYDGASKKFENLIDKPKKATPKSAKNK